MGKVFIKRWLLRILKAILLFFIISISSVLVYRFLPVPYTPLMLIRSASALFSAKPVGMEKKWVPKEEIAKSMKNAVIKAEDGKFYIHSGFDFEAIEKAIKYNKTHKKKKGASTISQQTAKNVFLWPSRSYVRKGLEAYFTVLIEFFWPKDRILEVYLNVIELGNGVYGVEAASQKFFHKKAKHLTVAESSLMAAVLPNPIKFKINKPSAYILRRQQRIMGSKMPEVTSEAEAKKLEEANSTEFLDIKFDEGDDTLDTSDEFNNIENEL